MKMKNVELQIDLLKAMVKFRGYELREIDNPRIVFKAIDKATKTMLRLDMEGELRDVDREEAEHILKECEIETTKLVLLEPERGIAIGMIED